MSATAAPDTGRREDRVDRRAVGLFLVVAVAGAWLVALPLWWSGAGLRTPGAGLLLLGMMVTPTLAALVAAGLPRRGSTLAADTGLRSPGGPRSWWRWALLAWLGPVALTALALVLAAALGRYAPDLVTFSGLRELLTSAGAGELPVPVAALAAAQVVQVLVVGWINTVPALAEEWGWRGWLLPQLLPWGRWPAILAVGVVWGLWHAPVVLLGYNYPGRSPVVALLLMVSFCVVAGTLLGWLRLLSRSVWPCAIAHGFVNAAAGLPLVFAAAGAPVDNASTGLLGWTGWVVMLACLAAGAAVVRARRRTA